jgi:drug/metabolite transporter (DMT)-like permease
VLFIPKKAERIRKRHAMAYDLKRPNFTLGIILALFAFLCIAVLSAIAKEAISQLNVEIVTFYQFLFCLVLTLPYSLRHGLGGLKTQHFGLHLIRDIGGFLGYFLLYYSLNLISLVDAVLLFNTSPLFIPFVVWIWFHLKPSLRLGVCLFVGFV